MNTITINEATITEAISEISGTSACGPDGMQASFFKNCAKEIVAPLIILFNKSLNEGVIPDAGACPGIRKRGGPKSESLFFFFFLLFNFSGGGAQLRN